MSVNNFPCHHSHTLREMTVPSSFRISIVSIMVILQFYCNKVQGSTHILSHFGCTLSFYPRAKLGSSVERQGTDHPAVCWNDTYLAKCSLVSSIEYCVPYSISGSSRQETCTFLIFMLILCPFSLAAALFDEWGDHSDEQ